jgi:hypothetical protein
MLIGVSGANASTTTAIVTITSVPDSSHINFTPALIAGTSGAQGLYIDHLQAENDTSSTGITWMAPTVDCQDPSNLLSGAIDFETTVGTWNVSGCTGLEQNLLPSSATSSGPRKEFHGAVLVNPGFLDGQKTTLVSTTARLTLLFLAPSGATVSITYAK